MGQNEEITVEKVVQVPSSTAHENDFDPQGLEDNARCPSRALASAIWAIVCGVALPCIPIIVITTVLLWVIFKHRIIPPPGLADFHAAAGSSDSEFLDTSNFTIAIYDARHNGFAPGYYVNYNPSTITTIASWTSRVVPYLSSSIMALVAFFAARHIVLKSKHGHHDELPTPKQLNILINLLEGNGAGPLKETMVHRWKSKEKLAAPLPAAFTTLAIITALGILIPIFDSWFGVAVHPVIITMLSHVSPDAYHSYGRELNTSNSGFPNCASGPLMSALDQQNFVHYSWPCNILTSQKDYGTTFLQGSQAVFAVELDQPTNDQISNYTGPVRTAGPGENVTVYFMGDKRSSENLDFRARTMGISTQCQIMTSQCFDGQIYKYDPSFFCPGGFNGSFLQCSPNYWPATSNTDVSNCPTGIGFSSDPQLSQMAGIQGLSNLNANDAVITSTLFSTNPIYFGTWSHGYPTSGDTYNPLVANNDPDVFPPDAVNARWLLNCSTTVYDIDYTYVNGALGTFHATLAAPEWGAFYSAPFAWQWGSNGLLPVSAIMQEAAFASSYTAQNGTDLANIWAREFSKKALSLSIGVFVPSVNELEQGRNNTVTVTRVPLVPLYILLGLKLLYVVVVIILAIGAYCFTHPAETEVVREQLSIKGLVAAHLETPSTIRDRVMTRVHNQVSQAKGERPFPGGAGVGVAVGAAAVGTAAVGATTGELAVEGQSKAEEDHEPKVGLLPAEDGSWKFALLMNGAWQSVKPIVKDFVLQESQTGKFGAMGDAYAAW